MTTFEYDDEIDIREYILIIINNWWKILIFSLLFAIIGFSINHFSPEEYQASATIIINRNQFVLSLAKQFPTVSTSKDTKSLSEAILSLTNSDAIALRTIDSLGKSLPLELRDPSVLNKTVSVSSEGDAILITSKTHDKELSALIANSWAKEAKDLINMTYSGVQPLVEIQGQLTNAERDYRSAQLTLEDFYGKSQIPSLKRQIQETENLLSKAIEDENWITEYNIQRKHSLERYLNETQHLKNQIDKGTLSTAAKVGDSLATLLARNKIIGLGEQEVITIQLTDITTMQDSQNDLSIDLDNLSETLQNDITELDQLISSGLSSSNIESTAQNIQALTIKLQSLNVQYEKENAEQKELITKRDLAWTTFSTLQAKETEIRTAMEANSIVSLASEAIAPQKPKAHNTLLFTVAGLVAGFAFGCFIFFAIEWWKSGETQPLQNN